MEAMQRPEAYSPAVPLRARASQRVRDPAPAMRASGSVRVRRLGSSTIVPRPFQRSDASRLVDALAAGGGDRPPRVLYQLASGAGKTVVASEAARRWLTVMPGSSVMWLTHREELRGQALDRMSRMGIDAFDLVALPPADRALRPGTAGVVSPSAQMRFGWDCGDLLVVDEAQHTLAPVWQAVVESWGGPVLGLTATPCRLSPGEGLGRVYDSMVHGPRVSQLVAEGHLSPVVLRDVDPPLVTGRGRSGLDYSMRETAAVHEEVFSSSAPADLWMAERASPDGRTVWYVPTVAAAEQLATALGRAGLPAAAVSSRTPSAQRAETMRLFSSGSVSHLVNVDIVTEGFDCPDVDTVMVLRPTKSLRVYLQMAGRAMRVTSSGPRKAVVVDAVRGWLTLGHPADDRAWDLSDGTPSTVRAMTAALCPHCGSMSAPTAVECCGCGLGLGKECVLCGVLRPPGDWHLGDSACDMCVSGSGAPAVWERVSRGFRMDLGRRGRFEALAGRGSRSPRLRWMPVGASPGSPASVVFRAASDQQARSTAEALCRGDTATAPGGEYMLTSTGLVPVQQCSQPVGSRPVAAQTAFSRRSDSSGSSTSARSALDAPCPRVSPVASSV